MRPFVQSLMIFTLTFSFGLSTWAQTAPVQDRKVLTPVEELRVRALSTQLYHAAMKMDVYQDYKKGYVYSEDSGPATAGVVTSITLMGTMPGIIGIIENGLDGATVKMIAVMSIVVGVIVYFWTKSIGGSEIKKPYQEKIKKMSESELAAEEQVLKDEISHIKAEIAAISKS